jgi:uncharacterized protein (DUF433 family)
MNVAKVLRESEAGWKRERLVTGYAAGRNLEKEMIRDAHM